MHCTQCGASLVQGQSFCSKCGHPVAGVRPMPPAETPIQSATIQSATSQAAASSAVFGAPSRVTHHLNTLGVLWIVYSVLRLVPGIGMLAFGSSHFPFLVAPFPWAMRGFLGPLVSALGAVVLGFAIAGIIAGWGLMSRAPWGRMLAIVIGCINLIHIPFGTALGAYTLWVLIPEGSASEYQRLTHA